MHWKAMFKGDFISAVEFNGRQPTFTIADVKLVAMEDEKTKGTKDKGTIFFKDQTRGWVLNKTNAICLAAMFGEETASWAGKRVTLKAQDVKFGPDTVPGIRIVGSPDLKGPMSVEVKLPKKKAFNVELIPTPTKGGSNG